MKQTPYIPIRIIAIIGILLLSIPVFTQEADTVKKEKSESELIQDSPILVMLDSLVKVKYFSEQFLTDDSVELNIYHFPPDSIPVYTDSVYQARIEFLNSQTPIELTYNNTVKNYIQLYGERKRDLTQRLLGLSKVYFPLFEEQLDRINIPLELKYLAIVESALIPNAGSRVGAKGLWQFMYGTGKVYGLGVTSYVDDRFDPIKSTIAACTHLKDLYDIYGD